MKFKLPKGSKSVSVSVEGKQSKVEADGTVEVAESIPAQQVIHLVEGLNWSPADPNASRRYREASGKGADVLTVEEAVAAEAAKNPESAKKVEAINQKR